MKDVSNHLASLNLVHQGDGELDFWGEEKAHSYKKFGDHRDGGNEIEFQSQFEEDNECCSPPLWETSMPKAINPEASPLLDRRHQYSCVSPRARSQAMLEGRRELMEMVRNMPESGYELSLRDMVDEAGEASHENLLIRESTLDSNPEGRVKKQVAKRRKNICNSGQFSRSGSMEKETFLIKMFIPSSLSWKKKVKAGNASKISPRPSFDGSQGDVGAAVSGRSRSCGSSSSIKSTIGYGHTGIFQGCWPFLCTRKMRSKRHAESSF